MDGKHRELIVVDKTADVPALAVITAIVTQEGRVFVDYSDVIAFLALNGCPAEVIKKFGREAFKISEAMAKAAQPRLSINDILGYGPPKS